MPSEGGSKKRKPHRRSGSGREVLLRTLSMRKWESEKRKSLGIPAEGFKGHVATDGSLLGTGGKWGACGWSVVQLDYDEELGFCMGCVVRWEQNSRFSAPSRGPR